jgi:peptidoglycan/LPS O-acetylase OafA/YrhL
LSQTFIIDAGVTWSLRYEWFFYAALPAMALVLGLAPRRRLLVVSVMACVVAALAMRYMMVSHLLVKILLPFGGGMVAAFAVRSERICTLCTHPAAGLLALACFSAAIIGFPGAYNIPASLLLSVGFIIIACGNTLSGLLTWPSTRLIGDMGYSVYLLHGILLFIVFHSLETMGFAVAGSAASHWAIVSALTIPLIVLCHVTFRMIELPAMKTVPNITIWLSAKSSKSSTASRTVSPTES